MSVINRMLQDLESRRGNPATMADLAFQIKAVPNRRRTTALFALLAGMAVAAVLLWLWWAHGRAAPTRPVVIASLERRTDNRAALQKNTLISVPTPAVAAAAVPAPINDASTAPIFGLKPSLFLELTPAVRAPTVISSQVATRAPKTTVVVAEPAPPAAAPATLSAEVRPVPVSPAAVKQVTPKQRGDNAYAAALTLLQEERSAEAAELLGTVLQQDPGNSTARQTLVGLLVAAKRYDEAQRQLQEGLRIDPAQSSQAMLLARLQVEQGSVPTALATLQRSLSAGAERADYQGFMAALLQREGRNREAIEHYQRALSKVPASGAWLTGLGISLQAENRVDEAHEAFERARASKSLSPELRAFVDQQLQR